MDPLSILGAVSTVTKTTYWISTTLFNFIQSSRVIDKTLEELNREVEGLTTALESIELGLKDPAISRAKSGGDTKGPWGCLDVAIKDTQRTVNALKGIVEVFGVVKKSSNPFKKAVKQAKLNLDADQISGIKDRIHTHTTSLQLALQTATLLISCQSSEGIQTVERLIKAMHLNIESSRKHPTDGRLPTKFRNPDLLKHTEQLISSASTVLGSKSTAWGGSEMRFPHSSENGQPLDRGQKATIEDWIPHLASMEEEPTQTSDHHDNSTTSETLVGTGGFNIEEVQSTDSDSDDDYDIAKKCFEKAKKEFSSDQHAKAMEFFRAGLKRAEKVGLKKKARLELRTIQMKMGLSLLSLGELSKSEQCLLSLAWPQTTDDKSKILALHASSGLAVICLCKRSFSEAEDWCNKSRIGWKRIAGKDHPAYITCLRLSAFSSELNGNHAEAAAIDEMANELKTAPRPVDTGLDAYESMGFTIEKSRTLVTEYHNKVPDTTRIEVSTQSKSRSPAKQSGSGPTDDPPTQKLAMSPMKPELRTRALGSLHDAIFVGDIDLVEKLLKNGADIEAKDKDGETALTSAAYRGHKSIVECLLGRGADIQAKDKDGWTALTSAAWQGHKSIVECLLDRGAEIEAKNEYGRTALIKAVLDGRQSTVECLLDRGANIEAKDNSGRTALISAAYRGHKSIVECLLDRGAEIEAKNEYGRTALSSAAYLGHKSIVECLLDRGADIEAKDKDGVTALMSAAWQGHKSIVECLLDRGADIEARNNDGVTPLLCACHWIDQDKLRPEIVPTIEFLCSNGADVSVTDIRGDSALKYARQVKDYKIQEDMIRVLKKYGAKD